MRATTRRAQGGFTMMEIMVSLVITIIGLSGVLMMQADTVKGNRRSVQFTRAAMIAEESMESARGLSVDTILAGVANSTVTYANVPYTVSLSAVEHPSSSNLVIVTVRVTYSEDGDTGSGDDRVASAQLIRTRTEKL